jgi:hypothetical protein
LVINIAAAYLYHLKLLIGGDGLAPLRCFP